MSSKLEETQPEELVEIEKRAGTTGKSAKTSWREILGVMAFYSILTAIMTWPLLINFGSAVPTGYEGDRYQNFWNFWWVKRALFNFQNPFLTDVLYYPYYNGTGIYTIKNNLPLYFHTLQLTNDLLMLPVTIVGGVAAAYNGIVFGSFVASGVGACLLAYHWVKNWPAALLAGVVFAFSGIRYDSMSYSWINIMSTEWLPFYILALHLWREQRKLRYLFGAIFCLTACAYTDWYNTTYLLLYTVFFFVIYSWPLKWWEQIKLLFPVGAGSFLAAAPLLVPSILELNSPIFITVYSELDKDYRGSTFLIELVNPLAPQGIVLWLTLLVCGAAFILRRKNQLNRMMLYWVIFGLVCFTLALGPKLQWERVRGAEPDGPYLPYYLFKKIPAAQIMRGPERFEIPGTLAMGVGLAFAVTALSKRGSKPKAKVDADAPTNVITENKSSKTFAPSPIRGERVGVRGENFLLSSKSRFSLKWQRSVIISTLVSVLVGGLVLGVVNKAPLQMENLPRDAFLDVLAKDKSNYNLLELPITRHNNFDYTRMYNQIFHNRPITGGYLSRPIFDPYRLPESPFRYLTEQMYEYDPAKEIFPAEYSQNVFDLILKLNHFDYVVVYKGGDDFKTSEDIQAVQNLLDKRIGKANMVQQDSRTTMYKAPPEFWQKAIKPGVLLSPEGWYGVESNQDGYYRWMRQKADFYVTTEKAGKLKISLTALAFGGDRPMRITANGRTVFEGRISPAPQPVEMEFDAKAGTTIFQIESLTPAQTAKELGLGNDPRQLAFLIRNLTLTQI